jgi:hypothetical protein
VREASCYVARMSPSPSWKMAMRGFDMRMMNGGWLRVVGMLDVDEGVCGWRSPICGMGAMRALWSL